MTDHDDPREYDRICPRCQNCDVPEHAERCPGCGWEVDRDDKILKRLDLACRSMGRSWESAKSARDDAAARYMMTKDSSPDEAQCQLERFIGMRAVTSALEIENRDLAEAVRDVEQMLVSRPVIDPSS